MKFFALSVLLLASPALAAENVAGLDTQACLQLIRDYGTEFESSSKEPTHLFEKFDAQCESTKELDKLMLNDDGINATIARLLEKGLL